MKGVVLVLVGVLGGAISLCGAGSDVEFGVGTDHSLAADPALMLRGPTKVSNQLTAQFVSDDRSEVRGGKPSVAYTVLRFDSKAANLSVQPMFGQINGAQIFLSF